MSNKLLCAFVHEQEVGEKFIRADWPLHATVVPWFQHNGPTDALSADVQQYLDGVAPFNARGLEKAHTRYVPLRDVTVLKPEPWQTIHNDLMPIVAKHAGTLLTRLFTGNPYRPHVTHQLHEVGGMLSPQFLHPSNGFPVEDIYMVEKRGRYREIIDRFRLGNAIGVEPVFTGPDDTDHIQETLSDGWAVAPHEHEPDEKVTFSLLFPRDFVLPREQNDILDDCIDMLSPMSRIDRITIHDKETDVPGQFATYFTVTAKWPLRNELFVELDKVKTRVFDAWVAGE